jgi:uncharacterized membrane protein YhiD involved in acid resistance
MRDLFISEFLGASVVVDFYTAIEHIAIAFLISLIIFITYYVTYAGVSYNRKFNVSLVMLTVISTIVMIVIGNSIALSLGMVGALSIVRFRTAIKDPRDTSYIFWTITIGIAVGSGNYMIAFIGSMALFLILVFFKLFSFARNNQFILIIRGERANTDAMMKIVFDFYKGSELRANNTIEDSVELVYSTKIKKNSEHNLIDRLYNVDGVTSVNIVAQNGEAIG